jgi:hypothetical protein
MKKNELKKLLNKKSKPLVGNNRSRTLQARRVTKRKYYANRQNFRIGNRTYYIPVKSFRTY